MEGGRLLEGVWSFLDIPVPWWGAYSKGALTRGALNRSIFNILIVCAFVAKFPKLFKSVSDDGL